MDVIQRLRAELKAVGENLRSYIPSGWPSLYSTSTDNANNDVSPVLTRTRRNAFAFAGSPGGCGAGAFAVAGASGTHCIQSTGDFGAMTSSVHAQISQMMNDMVYKFQSRPQQVGSYSSGGGILNIQVGGSPCGTAQQRTSYGGCAPAPAPQTHRIEIQVTGGQPQGNEKSQYQYPAPPSPCSSGSSPSPSGGCVMYQPSEPAYQPPSYAPSASYAAAASSSYAVSAPYSTSVDAQASYRPVDAYQSQAYASVPQPGL